MRSYPGSVTPSHRKSTFALAFFKPTIADARLSSTCRLLTLTRFERTTGSLRLRFRVLAFWITVWAHRCFCPIKHALNPKLKIFSQTSRCWAYFSRPPNSSDNCNNCDLCDKNRKSQCGDSCGNCRMRYVGANRRLKGRAPHDR